MHRLLETLCSKDFKGRGYIENGVNLAADYLTEALQQFHTKPFGYSYTQTYSLAVNTFPEPIICTVDGKEKKAGSDFLVDASSPGIKGRFHLTHFNMKDSLECMRLMQRIHHGFSANEVPVLHHYNAREKKYQDSSLFYHHEPCMWITTEDKKLTYTVSRSVAATPSLIFIDSALQRGDAMQITLKQKFQKKRSRKR